MLHLLRGFLLLVLVYMLLKLIAHVAVRIVNMRITSEKAVWYDGWYDNCVETFCPNLQPQLKVIPWRKKLFGRSRFHHYTVLGWQCVYSETGWTGPILR